MLAHQKENVIYEISSHEKPALRDYLLITQTAHLTEKGERGELYGKWNTVSMCEAGSMCAGLEINFFKSEHLLGEDEIQFKFTSHLIVTHYFLSKNFTPGV